MSTGTLSTVKHRLTVGGATVHTLSGGVQGPPGQDNLANRLAAEAAAEQAGEDRVQTGLDRTATGEDRQATAADRVATGEDREATAADRVQTGLDRAQTALDVQATGADRVATGEDAQATAADRVQTGQDRVATGEDRAQTGLDRAQIALDVQATAADRVQTGQDTSTTGQNRLATEVARDLANQFMQMAQGAAANGAAVLQQMLTTLASAAAIVTAQTASAASAGAAQDFAELARFYAQQSQSVVQQDLSGMQQVAHRNNATNPVHAFIYDTSRDYDGGLWTERMVERSWENEALTPGPWLPHPGVKGWQGEFQARTYGATLGAELVTNGASGFNQKTGTAGWNFINCTGSINAQGQLVVVATSTGTITAVYQPGGSQPTGVFVGEASLTPPTGKSVVFFIRGNNTGNSPTSGVIYGQGGSANNTEVMSFQWAGNPGETLVVDRVSTKQVTAFNTVSGSYFQDAANNGKCFRLFKNILANPSMVGGVDGTAGSTATTPTGWAWGTGGGGTVAFSPSPRYAGSYQVRYTATAARPYMAQVISGVVGGWCLVASCYVETLHSGTPSIQNIFLASFSNTATVTYRKNGIAVAAGTAVATGDFLEAIVLTGGGGNATFRHGIGADGVGTGDVTLSPMQVEYVANTATVASAFEASSVNAQSMVEVFRGNMRKFPKQALVVIDTVFVTIFDLTQKGCPMFWRWQQTGVGFDPWRSGRNASDGTMLNGRLYLATGPGIGDRGLLICDFIKDKFACWTNIGFTTGYAGWHGNNLAQRHTFTGYNFDGSNPAILNGYVNQVAVYTYPTAEIDPTTGMPRPTVLVATPTGMSVIREDGTVVNDTTNSGQSCPAVGFTPDGRAMRVWNGDARRIGVYKSASKVPTAHDSGNYSTNWNLYGDNATGPSMNVYGGANIFGAGISRGGPGRSMLASAGSMGLYRFVDNMSTPTMSMYAAQGQNYVTGWQFGNTARDVMTDCTQGIVGRMPDLTTNGAFTTDLTGWTDLSTPAGSISWDATNGGCAKLVRSDAGNARMGQALATVPGRMYRVELSLLSTTGGLQGAVGTGPGLTDVSPTVNISSPIGTVGFYFTATGTTSHISFRTTQIGTTLFKDVTVREVAGQLLLNGSFDRDLTAWNSINGSGGTNLALQSYDTSINGGGMVKLTGVANGDRTEQQLNNLVPGQAYEAVVNAYMGTATGYAVAVIRGVAGGYSSIKTSGTQTTSGVVRLTFVAPATDMILQLSLQNANGSSQTMFFDNAIVRPIESDRSFRMSPNLQVGGTLTRSPVAVAAQACFVSGFSNDLSFTTEMSYNGWAVPTSSGYDNTLGTTSAAGFTTTSVSSPCRVYINFNTVPGRKYTISNTASALGSSSVSYFVREAWDGVGTILATSAPLTLNNPSTMTFTATTARTCILWVSSSGGAGMGFTIANVSFKAAEAWGGVANVLQENVNSTDVAYGAGAHWGAAWINVPVGAFGPGNWLRYSEDYTQAQWAKIGSPTITANADGIAQKITRAAGNNSYVQQNPSGFAPNPGGPIIYRQTFKAGAVGGRVGMRIGGTYPNRGDALFDLTNGTLVGVGNGGTASGTTATIVPSSFGPGYYDCEVRTTLVDAFGYVLFSPVDAAWTTPGNFEGATAGTTNCEVYATKAQLSRGGGSMVTPPYATTAASAVTWEAPIEDYSGPSGAYRRFGLSASGYLTYTVFDGSNLRGLTSSFPINDGAAHFVMYTYDGAGKLSLYVDPVDGKPQTTVTVPATQTLTNVFALMTWGNRYTLDAAFPGSIAMARTGPGNPFAEQIALAFTMERDLFQPGAQCLVPDGSLLGRPDYDDMRDVITVASAQNACVFDGFIRTEVTAITAGAAYKTSSARGGWKAWTRVNLFPGVDVTVPSLNLREQLLKRAEEAARQARLTKRMDFDTTTGQTVIRGPAGWEWQGVTLNGTEQREGTGKQWTRTFDGFCESVNFTTSPNIAWVQGELRRLP